MAGTAKRTVTIGVLLDDLKARTGLKKLGSEAEQTGSRWSKMGATAKAGVALAATAVVKFLGDATKNAIADEAAQRQLALAVKNSTGATEDQTAAVEDYITQTSLATGVTDDELRPAFANLVRATRDVEEAQTLMSTAMDIATARGLPLEAVTLAIGKAAQGNIGALGRLGLAVRDSSGAYLDFEEAIAQANETMGGATAEAADSAEGKLRRVQIAADEAKEEIGAALIPAFEAAIPVIMDLAKFVGMAATEFNQWTGNMSDMEAGIADWERALGRSATTAEDALGIWSKGGIDFGELLDQLKLGPKELLRLDGATDEYLHTLGLANEDIDEFRANLKNAIRASTDSRGEQTKAVVAQQALGDEYDITTDAIYAQIDAEKALTDPLFRLIDANQRAEKAQKDYALAVSKGGEYSQDAKDAALDLVKAHQDAEAAAEIFALEGGQDSIDAVRQLAEDAGLSEDAIRRLITQLDRANDRAIHFNALRSQDPSGRTYRGGVQQGGYVRGGTPYLVGERGPEIMVPNQSGRVIPNAGIGPHMRGGRAGAVYNVTVNAGMGADGNAIGREVVQALQRYERANGAIPIRVRG